MNFHDAVINRELRVRYTLLRFYLKSSSHMITSDTRRLRVQTLVGPDLASLPEKTNSISAKKPSDSPAKRVQASLYEDASHRMTHWITQLSVANARAAIQTKSRLHCNWYSLGCDAQSGGSVCINKVGTFCVASASYWFSCCLGTWPSLPRLCWLRGHGILLLADDCHQVVFFIICAVGGIPVSWHKTAGGDLVSWVDFELLHR